MCGRKGHDFHIAPYIYYAYSSLFIENNEQSNRAPLDIGSSPVMEKKKKEKKVEVRLSTEKCRRREGKRRKNGAGKGRKREKKWRATKSSFIVLFAQ